MSRNFFYMVFASLTIMVACSKEEDQPSVAENKATLETMDQQILQDFTDLSQEQSGIAVSHMMKLMSMADPFGGGFKSSNLIVARLKQVFLPQIKKSGIAEDRFDFQANVGTYSWNHTFKAWDVQHGVPVDKIIINFPSDSLNTTNDGRLTLSDYEDVAFVDDEGYSYYQPKTILADLKIENDVLASVDFSATYGTSFQPVSASVTLVLKPAEFYLSWNDNGSKMSISNHLKFNNKKMESIDVDVKYILVNEEPQPTYIDGFIQYGPVKLSGNIDIAGIEQKFTQPGTSLEDLNQEINLAIYNYPEGSKIAKLELYAPVNEEELPVQLVFTDGTKENVQGFLDKLSSSLQLGMAKLGFEMDQISIK